MESYHALLADVMNNGRGHADRTGVGTRSVFGRQWRHNMQSGFPLLTTKRVTARWVFEELVWFLSGSTNNADLLKSGVDIWDEFADENGELGPVYGRQARSISGFRFVKQVEIAKPESQPIPRVKEPLLPDTSLGGGEVLSCADGNFTVLRIYEGTDDSGKRRKLCDIQFETSGYVSVGLRLDAVKVGRCKDKYAPNIYGVACIGEGSSHDPLYPIWASIIQRCYSEKFSQYADYGGRGVWVCDRWLIFSNFLEDAYTLPNWECKKAHPAEFSIDKDMSGFNFYSPDTCVWSSRAEQAVNQRDLQIIEATSPNKEIFLTANATEFAIETGLSQQSISACLTGKKQHHRNWQFSYLDNPDGFRPVYYQVDQVLQLLSQIQFQPNSRRLIVSHWNPSMTNYMSLPPCHTMYQLKCYEDTREISLHLYARSIDIFLGLPYNIASYAFLLSMIGFATGYKPLELVISFGDLHLYNNHTDQATTQLGREPYALPKLEISESARCATPLETLLNIRWEHINISGYQHHPKIEADVAI